MTEDTIINSLECCLEGLCESCSFAAGGCKSELLYHCLTALKAQQLHEITKKEWEAWKHKPDGRREPLYFMWVDCAPGMWVIKPEEIDEVAFLTGEIKIWNKEPSWDMMDQIQRGTWKKEGK